MLIEKVALGCRILGGEGLSRGAFGHLSARLGDGTIAMKSRGPNEEGLEFATARDVVILRLDGTVLEAGEGLTAPNESHIHTEILRARSDVNSVVHIHPPLVVALLAADQKLAPRYGAYDPTGLRLARGTLRYYPKSLLISTPGLGNELAAALGGAKRA